VSDGSTKEPGHRNKPSAATATYHDTMKTRDGSEEQNQRLAASSNCLCSDVHDSTNGGGWIDREPGLWSNRERFLYELEAPDHLPNSLLCPISENNPKGPVLGFCVVSPRVYSVTTIGITDRQGVGPVPWETLWFETWTDIEIMRFNRSTSRVLRKRSAIILTPETHLS